jgi:hypothetical protein
MGKSRRQTETQTSRVDPATAAYINAYRQRAQQGNGAAPWINQYGQTAQGLAGNLDFASQTGLQGLDQFMNPYMDSVIAGVQSDFDRQRALAQNAAADQATRAGAFGGDREAILRANALNDVNRNETQALSGLRSQGYTDAVNQLLAQRGLSANLGLAGMQGLLGTGQALSANELAYLQGMAPGFTPISQTNQTTTQTSGGGLQDVLGGLLTLGSIIPGPWQPFAMGANALGSLSQQGG